MSDDEADLELLELLRQSLGLSKHNGDEVSSDTGVLRDAEYVYTNAIDVSIDMYGTKGAAASIYTQMQQRRYSTQAWSQHELHPTIEEGFSDVGIVNFIFTMDLLNFCFWSDLSEEDRFQVAYRGGRWTGYKSLLACLQRALDEGLPITSPHFWNDPECTDDVLKHVFRSATNEQMPLLDERIAMLREAGQILAENFGGRVVDPAGEVLLEGAGEPEKAEVNVAPVEDAGNGNASELPAGEARTGGVYLDSALNVPAKPQVEDTQGRALQEHPPDMCVVRLIESAGHSTGRLVNLLAKHFPSFQDEHRFDGKRVRVLKRAQIFVADLWAAFNGGSFGQFDDIDLLTMFADYRVPQMLRSLGVLVYSPPLEYAISRGQEILSGHSWEVQLRGCSIWAVELIRREILRQHPEAEGVNAVLIDFLLYDIAKEREAAGECVYDSTFCVLCGEPSHVHLRPWRRFVLRTNIRSWLKPGANNTAHVTIINHQALTAAFVVHSEQDFA